MPSGIEVKDMHSKDFDSNRHMRDPLPHPHPSYAASPGRPHRATRVDLARNERLLHVSAKASETAPRLGCLPASRPYQLAGVRLISSHWKDIP